jgi:hypothetical protein
MNLQQLTLATNSMPLGNFNTSTLQHFNAAERKFNLYVRVLKGSGFAA